MAPISNKRRCTNYGEAQDPKIAELEKKLALVTQERDDRTKLLETVEAYAESLKKTVVSQKSIIKQQEDIIKRLQMENRTRIQDLEESKSKRAEAQSSMLQKNEKIQELESIELEITKSALQEVQRSWELQEEQEKSLLAIAQEKAEQEKELEAYKLRVAQLESSEMEEMWRICEEYDCGLKKEHEMEKREWRIEILARQRALEMLGEKLREVAHEDVYFRFKLKEINFEF